MIDYWVGEMIRKPQLQFAKFGWQEHKVYVGRAIWYNVEYSTSMTGKTLTLIDPWCMTGWII